MNRRSFTVVGEMADLTDDQLDQLAECLPDCIEIYGPYRPRHAPECRHDDLAELVAEVRRLRAELADAKRLAIGSRMVLDRCAEGLDAPDEAADQAQRIVDIYGHAVTDEPPHAVLALRAAEAERDRLLDGIREVIGYGVVFDAKGTHSKRVVRRLRELLPDQEDGRG